MRKLAAVLASSLLISNTALAAAQQGWSWGFGYHNPPGATVGLNFMHLWTHLALELGVGYIGSNENDNATATANANNPGATDQQKVVYTVAGDLNLKYLFGSGGFRPYLQGGFGTAVSTTNSGQVAAGASVDHPFGGFGFFAFGNSFYFYLSYLFMNANEIQLGFGFPF